MIAIATNIYDFTNWLKYGEKYISKDSLIDFAKIDQNVSDLFDKIGLFEESFEVFFCVISPNFNMPDKEIFQLSIFEIVEIKPLSEKVKNVLQLKLGDYNISSPIDSTLYEKIICEKLKRISENGMAVIQDMFFEKYDFSEKFIISLLDIKLNIFLGDLRKKEIKFDFLLKYARNKPFPITDIGYFYDVGTIIREMTNISDDDLQNKDILKGKDPEKYDIILSVIELSKFIALYTKSKGLSNPFDDFIRYYSDNEIMIDFNSKFKLDELPEDINYVLLFALYFKFCNIIRSQNDLTLETFIAPIKKFLKICNKEAIIAISICGYMFGSLKFQRLSYNLLNFPLMTKKEIKIPEITVTESTNKNIAKDFQYDLANTIIIFIKSNSNEVYINDIYKYLKEIGVKANSNGKHKKIYKIDEIKEIISTNKNLEIYFHINDRKKKKPLVKYKN